MNQATKRQAGGERGEAVRDEPLWSPEDPHLAWAAWFFVFAGPPLAGPHRNGELRSSISRRRRRAT